MLGHTRWASVGIISEPNAHPVNSDELEQPGGAGRRRTSSACSTATSTTTPTSRWPSTACASPGRSPPTPRSSRPSSPATASPAPSTSFEAFRRTVSSFEGSVAIGVAAADEPGRLYLALHGSGQGVYIGLAEDRYVVASEPYGVVEETDRYVRLDGEHGGQVVELDAAAAGTIEGIRRRGYDGSPSSRSPRPTSPRPR